jgi:hypothetical protein
VDSPALVQGLEVYVYMHSVIPHPLTATSYATEEALAVTHRNGKAYKHMREVVASTGLLSYPKGGVPTYRPAGGGFLSKPGVPETVGSEEYFVLVKYIVRGGDAVSRGLREERQLADELKVNEGVFAVWSFVPEGRNDDEEEGVLIALFIRLRGVADYAGAVEECVSQFE